LPTGKIIAYIYGLLLGASVYKYRLQNNDFEQYFACCPVDKNLLLIVRKITLEQNKNLSLL